MAKAMVKYGSKKCKKMLNELCKEAAELSADFNCKVGIFIDPAKVDEKFPMFAFGSPSVESVLEEYWKAQKKAEKRKKKQLMAKIKKKAKLNIPEGNGGGGGGGGAGTSASSCKLGGAPVAEGADAQQ